MSLTGWKIRYSQEKMLWQIAVIIVKAVIEDKRD